MDTILLMLMLFTCFLLMMQFRVPLVYKWRSNMIKQDFTAHLNGPSHNYMLWTFWIWDVKRYYPKEEI